jgi:Domain of unknown function (DUF4350)
LKERLTTLALALGALALFYALLFPKPSPDRDADELPLSTTAGDHGYQALWRWLRAEQIPVEVLHGPFDQLESPARGRGNVLIVTLPPRLPIRKVEMPDLDAWVARGNTLLVMAALDDTPTWSLGADPSFLKSLSRMTGLEFEVIPEPSDARGARRQPQGKRLIETLQALEPQRVVLTARGRQPLFGGVRSVLAISEYPASHWRAVAKDGSAILQIAQRPRSANSSEEEPAVWLRSRGDGQIIVAGFASIFSNALIGEHDNARLFANILAWSRSPSGHVIFDDGHQGAVDYYDAKAFFADSRLHRTILWMIFLWLLFVLGWQRLRPAADAWNPLDVTAFISATGDFFASTLTPATAGARLFENFFDTVRRRLGLGEGIQPVWARMAADARCGGPELSELERLYANIQARERVDLVRLQTLISRALGNLE